ncbi:MAG: CIA30 family protein [Woeseiaceae bacterium]|nr:CIA30 family protein [Woeseiaceae bacterium]
MKSLKSIACSLAPGLALAALMASPSHGAAEGLAPLVDDFSHAKLNSAGVARQFLNDSMAGGRTSMTPEVSDGVLSVSGEIAPPRGQPGWASSVLILDPEGVPQDASQFEGVRLRIKINKGMLSVSANSMDVTNFDYHAAPIAAKADGEFHEVKIPFKSMKRTWSEQTALNTTNIQSLSIVAFDVQNGAYDFELDEVSFY